MKIAFFSKCLPSDEPNGVSVQVHRLALALVKAGHEIDCYSFSPKPENASYKHYLLEFKSKDPVAKKFMPALLFRKVEKGNYDIVHYHGDDYLSTGGKNRVRTFYGSALMEALHALSVKRFFYQLLFYSFELISCMKRGAKVGISRNTCRTLPFVKRWIPCCVPLDTFRPGKFKTKYPTVLFVGTIDGRKRGRLVLDLFQRDILPKHPECQLIVVGPQPCSGTNVVYKGRVSESELIELYQSSWVYCLASSYEGFGVPAIEALACGCAVVAVENWGTREVIRSGIDGILCSEKTLGLSVAKVISDDLLRSNLIGNGLSSAKNYCAAKIAAEYEDVYRMMVQGLPHAGQS